eukprot:c28916_g1_i1 orf=2-664(-)
MITVANSKIRRTGKKVVRFRQRIIITMNTFLAAIIVPLILLHLSPFRKGTKPCKVQGIQARVHPTPVQSPSVHKMIQRNIQPTGFVPPLALGTRLVHGMKTTESTAGSVTQAGASLGSIGGLSRGCLVTLRVKIEHTTMNAPFSPHAPRPLASSSSSAPRSTSLLRVRFLLLSLVDRQPRQGCAGFPGPYLHSRSPSVGVQSRWWFPCRAQHSAGFSSSPW